MVTIAVDAMGGDHAPKAEVDGSIRAARSLGVKIILVGKQDLLRKELAQHDGIDGLPIDIQHASEQVTMEDSAAKAMRTKRGMGSRAARSGFIIDCDALAARGRIPWSAARTRRLRVGHEVPQVRLSGLRAGRSLPQLWL